MNTSTLDDLADRIPSRSTATSTIVAALDDVADRLPRPDLELPDLSKPARRTRRLVARVVPGVSTRRLDDVRDRASARWVVVAVIVLTAVAAFVVVRRRAQSSRPDTTRDDWATAPSGDSRSADVDAPEPAPVPG